MNKLGLIGYPLGHSFSAGYFAEKFKQLNITNFEYNNFPIESIGLFPDLVKKETDLIGLNVTIPYKQQVIPYLNELSTDAKGIGAVNTIKITRQGDKLHLKGFNTDCYGFEQPLLPFLSPEHKKALILGTGGAAKAVAWIFEKYGIEYQYVSRVPKVQNAIAYSKVTAKLLSDTYIIVNSSPLGMHPNIDACPNIPYNALTPKHVLYDLIYNPEKTLFLNKGAEQGATIINGLKMLQLQADKAWEIWRMDE